jgi:prepilin-type N-terminal cleavage/methylation domain-containing protein
MRTGLRRAEDCPPCQRGLSLVEMMVTVALMSVIIFGLVAMFEQTRKAFTAGLANVDYQDSGRVAMDLIARDLQQMAPAKAGVVYANSIGAAVGTNLINFYSDFEPNVKKAYVIVPGNVNPPNPPDEITNVMQRVLFVTQYNQTWSAVGYRVDPTTSATGVGTLYRYRVVGPVSGGSSSQSLTSDFLNGFSTDTNAFSPVIDGVVGFRVRTYDPNGNEILPQTVPGAIVTAANPATYPQLPGLGNYGYVCVFSNNLVPASVEIELSVMESKTLDRYRSMNNNPTNAPAFWTNHVGQMHVFKQRVSIPSLDRTAFP